MTCENCKHSTLMALVQYGSYYLQCRRCKVLGPATSFMGLRTSLTGTFEIIEIDAALNPIQTLATGNIVDYLQLIENEAGKGKIIRLKNITNE